MDLSVILALTVVGVILIAVDFYIPGFFLTALGVILMIVADVLCGLHHSLTVTLSLVCAQIIVAGTAAWCSLKYFPRSKLGQRMMLHSSLAQARASHRVGADLVGHEGIAQTVLRPSGIGRIDGKRLDVVAESDMIERGSRIRVVAVERNRILVRKA
jgi:membrane-bound serine protease (ClpP class)